MQQRREEACGSLHRLRFGLNYCLCRHRHDILIGLCCLLCLLRRQLPRVRLLRDLAQRLDNRSELLVKLFDRRVFLNDQSLSVFRTVFQDQTRRPRFDQFLVAQGLFDPLRGCDKVRFVVVGRIDHSREPE